MNSKPHGRACWPRENEHFSPSQPVFPRLTNLKTAHQLMQTPCFIDVSENACLVSKVVPRFCRELGRARCWLARQTFLLITWRSLRSQLPFRCRSRTVRSRNRWVAVHKWVHRRARRWGHRKAAATIGPRISARDSMAARTSAVPDRAFAIGRVAAMDVSRSKSPATTSSDPIPTTSTIFACEPAPRILRQQSAQPIHQEAATGHGAGCPMEMLTLAKSTPRRRPNLCPAPSPANRARQRPPSNRRPAQRHPHRRCHNRSHSSQAGRPA